MRLQRTTLVWEIMMIGLAVLLAGCGLAAVPAMVSATDAPLLHAQSRWQSHHPAHYRLIVQEDTSDRSCRQAVEVHNEQVQAVLEDHCGRATPWTISSLLDWIGYHAQTSSAYTSAALVSICQVHHSTRAVYDPTLGYPYTVMYQQSVTPNQTYRRVWQRLGIDEMLPTCARAAGSNTAQLTIRVVSLTALP
jgi:hypothetical protein